LPILRVHSETRVRFDAGAVRSRAATHLQLGRRYENSLHGAEVYSRREPRKQKEEGGRGMSHHFTANTESASAWCNHCSAFTQHAVSVGRIGRCLQHEAPQFSKAQLRRREQNDREAREPRLF
jgi:hypothetical protein